MPLCTMQLALCGQVGHTIAIKYFQNFTFKQDKSYLISLFPLHCGGCRPQPVFLRVLFGHGGVAISTSTSLWAATGDVVKFKDEPRHIPRSRGSHRGTASFWAALGESPWWALFLIMCICGPVDFVHVKHPPASWVQTKGHSPLLIPACAGGDLVALSIFSSLVLWIQWVCQSPEPGSWETSTDFSSLSALLLFLFLHECSQVLIEPIRANLCKGGSLYHLLPILYATLRQNREIGPSLC